MHGIFKGEPPRRDRTPGGRPGLALALRLLLREAALGCVLLAVLGRGPGLDVVVCAMVLAALGLTTRRYGLLDRKHRFGWVAECLVVFCGALVFRNVLILAAGLVAALH